MNETLRRAVLTVAILNLGYFGVEFAVAVTIRSVSLFADSIDVLEDASVNLLIALALTIVRFCMCCEPLSISDLLERVSPAQAVRRCR